MEPPIGKFEQTKPLMLRDDLHLIGLLFRPCPSVKPVSSSIFTNLLIHFQIENRPAVPFSPPKMLGWIQVE
jgi:hypothetical protein